MVKYFLVALWPLWQTSTHMSLAAIIFSNSEQAELAFAPTNQYQSKNFTFLPTLVVPANAPPGLQYALKCSEAGPKPEPYCENLERSIETLQETDEKIGVPIYLYLAGDDISIV